MSPRNVVDVEPAVRFARRRFPEPLAERHRRTFCEQRRIIPVAVEDQRAKAEKRLTRRVTIEIDVKTP
jgi:hypothetical protein